MIYRSDLLNTGILKYLVSHIIVARRMGKKTYSCQVGYRPLDKLQEIITEAVFKEDYETNTSEFLSEYVDYETTINSLQEIITKGWMPDEIPEDPSSLIKE